MFQHDIIVPGSASDWLARAKSDLAIAKAPLPEGALYEDLCFHAQQATERPLKQYIRIITGFSILKVSDLKGQRPLAISLKKKVA